MKKREDDEEDGGESSGRFGFLKKRGNEEGEESGGKRVEEKQVIHHQVIGFQLKQNNAPQGGAREELKWREMEIHTYTNMVRLDGRKKRMSV